MQRDASTSTGKRLPPAGPETVLALERRLGRIHARQRLGIEQDFEAHVFGHGLNFFHIENWYSGHALIKAILKATGLYWRGLKNAGRLEVRRNRIAHPAVPKPFSGFTILQLSDLHVDKSTDAMTRLEAILDGLACDLCVMTGDYRALTYGRFDRAIEGLQRLVRAIRAPMLGVLGNHDSILMLPALEAMGVRILLNEATAIERAGTRIHIAGIDDAHYFRVENIEKAAGAIPPDDFSILLSHTPEIYRQAAHADFNVMLAGHTHGGQICLPGGFALKLNAVLPRRLGMGAWRYGTLQGYTSAGVGTSIVTARFNCPPEITLHRLECA
jgi:hypothetical protein